MKLKPGLELEGGDINYYCNNLYIVKGMIVNYYSVCLSVCLPACLSLCTCLYTSLEHRRATSRLCMLYQIYHGSIGIPHDPYILPYRHTPRPSRQTDMHTLATYQCRTNYFKCSFFPQTIVAWNALTKSVVTSSTLDAFKAPLPLGRPIPC